MLNQIISYYRRHRRDAKKNIRTNYTRPMKNALHCYKIQLINQIGELKSSFFQLKNLRFIGYFVIVFWLFRDFAFAEDTGNNAVTGINSVVEFLNGIIFIIALIVQPIVMFVGWLLSPDWTFGDVIGLRPVIHSVWIIVSNVVYFIFAIMLIVIALMNIFSENKSFALKSSLPRLVVGILMVPFTWFVVSATLSVANVLTASVISFSYESIKAANPDSKNSFINKKIIPKTINVDLTEDEDWEGDGAKTHAAATGSGGDYHNYTCNKDGNDTRCLSLMDILGSGNGAYNLLSYYAYGIFKIDTIKELGDNQAGKSVKKIGDIFKKLTFGLLFTLIFAILVIAIAFALITRMAMLWIYTMFSPFFALSYFLGGKGPKGLEKMEKKINIKSFIALAMVPVYVSAALSFGLILLSFAMNTNFKNSGYVTVSSGGAQDSNYDQTFTFGEDKNKQVNLVIMGKYTEDDSSGILGNVFGATQGIISNVIISFLALVILWMAVMAALGASEITEKAVKPIAEFGDSIGKLMVDAPKYIPLKIPGTSGKDGKPLTMTIEGMSSLGQNIKGHYEQMARQAGSDFATHFTGKSDLAEPINKLTSAINSSKTAVTTQQLTGLKSILDAAKGDTTLIANDPNARTVLKSFLDVLKTKDEKIAGELGKLTLTNPDEVARYFAGMDHFTDIHEKEYGVSIIDSADHKGGNWKNESRESIKKQANGGTSANTEPNTNPKPTQTPKITKVKFVDKGVNHNGDNVEITVDGIMNGATNSAGHKISITTDKFKGEKDVAKIVTKLTTEGLVGDKNELEKIAEAIIKLNLK